MDAGRGEPARHQRRALDAAAHGCGPVCPCPPPPSPAQGAGSTPVRRAGSLDRDSHVASSATPARGGGARESPPEKDIWPVRDGSRHARDAGGPSGGVAAEGPGWVARGRWSGIRRFEQQSNSISRGKSDTCIGEWQLTATIAVGCKPSQAADESAAKNRRVDGRASVQRRTPPTAAVTRQRRTYA